MINKITITNHLDESLVLELRSPEKSGFFVRGIDGLTPGKATINVTEVLSNDGAFFNSARVGSRNIVFDLGFLEHSTIEETRKLSYKFFPIKKLIKIQIETDTRTAFTYGYVESNEPNIFNKEEGTTISVLCPRSFFYSVDKNTTVFSGIQSFFEFPFSNESLTEKLIVMGEVEINREQTVFYTGDSEIGVVIYIQAFGNVENLRFVNVSTSEQMLIDTDKLTTMTGFGIIDKDFITISTLKGNKYITLQRDGEIINIINALGQNTDWFQIQPGDNVLVYTADSGAGNIHVQIENQIVYEGI